MVGYCLVCSALPTFIQYDLYSKCPWKHTVWFVFPAAHSNVRMHVCSIPLSNTPALRQALMTIMENKQDCVCVSEEMVLPCTRYRVCPVFRKTFFVLEPNSWPHAYKHMKDHTHTVHHTLATSNALDICLLASKCALKFSDKTLNTHTDALLHV